MKTISVSDQYGYVRDQRGMVQRSYDGEVEFEIRMARTGALVNTIRQHNIIKIFAKEILSHRTSPNKVWDPNANGGVGAWVYSSIDIDQYAPRYIVFGASFDVNGFPLDTADTRFYTYDPVSQSYTPNSLDVGATYDGGLINAIPISEPVRPLKRVERVYFEPSYQPAGVPLLQNDVRAINNVLVLETVLRAEEYNGMGRTLQDFFTITEVGLVGAREVIAVGQCELNPRAIFLDGNNNGVALSCSTSGTATITLVDGTPAELINLINEGDQVKLVADDGDKNAGTLGQISPYYLVISKAVGGRDMVLDRTPVDFNNIPLAGTVGVFRDGFRLFSHRLLSSPVKKSSDYEITVRWRCIFD